MHVHVHVPVYTHGSKMVHFSVTLLDSKNIYFLNIITIKFDVNLGIFVGSESKLE